VSEVLTGIDMAGCGCGTEDGWKHLLFAGCNKYGTYLIYDACRIKCVEYELHALFKPINLNNHDRFLRFYFHPKKI